MTMQTTYTKLSDGSWGVRSTGQLAVGMSVLVAKRDGSTKNERVSRIVSSGNGVWIAAVDSAPRQAARQAPRYGRGAGSAVPVAGYSPYCTNRPGCRCFDCS